MDELERLLEEERNLAGVTPDYETAWSLGTYMRERARDRGLPLAIRIDCHGQILFQCGLPGASRDNEAWLRGKSRVVYRFGHSSLYVARRLESKGRDLNRDYGLDGTRYRASGGSFPLTAGDGPVIGTITVSGLSGEEDHRFVADCLAGWAGKVPAGT